MNAHLASIINSKWAVLENGFLQKDLDEINREDPEIWGANTRLNDLKRSNATQNPFKDVSHFFKADNEMSKGVKTLLER